MNSHAYLALLKSVAPEVIVVVTALAVLSVDLLATRELEARVRSLVAALISCLGCGAAIAWLMTFQESTDSMTSALILDATSRVLKISILALSGAITLLTVPSGFTRNVGEYTALILLATVGLLLLVSAADILLMFVSLELTSLSLYILAAFDRRNPLSAEAALKYYLFGSVSAAFTLFGLSLLYGISGATSFSGIAATIQGPRLDPLLLLAIVMTVAGLGFKVAAAPFHFWAPDVYQAAPAPSAAFIASASKVAGFIVLARMISAAFDGAQGNAGPQAFTAGWTPLLAVMAAISMVLGNLAALAQSSVRRLLAYSAIAHAGYMLLGVISQPAGFEPLVYYVVTYALATLGAFGIVSLVEREQGGDLLSDFAGLSRRAPVLGLCMLVFLLSLAGIPPLAGFFGKVYIFAEALRTPAFPLQLLWLVILAIAMSAVSLYYYLIVLKQVFVAEPKSIVFATTANLLPQMVIVLLAVSVIVLGCVPDLLLRFL